MADTDGTSRVELSCKSSSFSLKGQITSLIASPLYSVSDENDSDRFEDDATYFEAAVRIMFSASNSRPKIKSYIRNTVYRYSNKKACFKVPCFIRTNL